MTRLTDWFPANVKPVREGVYATKFGRHEGFSHWSGQVWSNQYRSIALLLTGGRDWGLGGQLKEWRGLAEKPE